MSEAPARRLVIAIVGGASPATASADLRCAEDLGRLLVDAGCAIVTGGMSGIMEAASRGGRSSDSCGDASVIGMLPSYDRTTANAYVQLAIPTGMQLARNALVVAMADAVIAIGGGSGTLSEIALAWQLGKPVVALTSAEGWSAELAGRRLDTRFDTEVVGAPDATQAAAAAIRLARSPRKEPGAVGSGWHGDAR